MCFGKLKADDPFAHRKQGENMFIHRKHQKGQVSVGINIAIGLAGQQGREWERTTEGLKKRNITRRQREARDCAEKGKHAQVDTPRMATTMPYMSTKSPLKKHHMGTKRPLKSCTALERVRVRPELLP